MDHYQFIEEYAEINPEQWAAVAIDLEIRQFRAWHNRRMKELNYPPEIVAELTHSREKFLGTWRRTTHA